MKKEHIEFAGKMWEKAEAKMRKRGSWLGLAALFCCDVHAKELKRLICMLFSEANYCIIQAMDQMGKEKP